MEGSTAIPKVRQRRFFNRNRKERPCDNCRRRKCKCVRPQGSKQCEQCTEHDEQCTYVLAPPPRRRRLSKPLSDSESPEEIPLETSIDRSAVEHDEGMSIWKPELFLSMNEEYYSELLSGPLAISASSTFGMTLNIDNDHYLRSVSVDVAFMMTRDREIAVDQQFRARILEVVAPHQDKLLNLYFEVIHSAYPIIHKESFFWKWARKQLNPALLAAMFLLASQWWTYSPELVTEKQVDLSKLASLAMECYQRLLDRPRLSTIQAGLLLMQTTGKVRNSFPDSWLLTAQIVACAQKIGLHLDCSNWSIPSWEIPPRRKVAWAVYIHDTWSSAFRQLPAKINSRDWFVFRLDIDDFELSSADPSSKTSLESADLTIELVNLTIIVSDILNIFYFSGLKRPSIMPNDNAVFSVAEPIWDQLKEWSENLPPFHLFYEIQETRLKTGEYLILMYQGAKCLLSKAMILYLENSSVDHSETFSMEEQEKVDMWKSRALECATSSVSFIKNLTLNSTTAFWLQQSSQVIVEIGSLISVLILTSKDEDEIDKLYSLRNELTWKLTLMGKAFYIVEDSLAELYQKVWRVCDTIRGAQNSPQMHVDGL